MHPLLEALLFGLTVAAMFVGLFGIILPIIPGTILIYLSALGYAVLEGFNAVDWLSFTVITLIALVAVTADFWMPILGVLFASRFNSVIQILSIVFTIYG